MSLCYTREEIAELAHRERPSAICRWLDKLGAQYVLDADGWPQVPRTAILDQPAPRSQDSEPQLDLS